MSEFPDLSHHGAAFGEGEGTHVDEACHAAGLLAALETQTVESVGSDLPSVGMHDGDDGMARVDEALHVPSDKCRVGG